MLDSCIMHGMLFQG